MLTKRQKSFRDRAVALSQRIAPEHQLDWRIMAAAAILESGWGESDLARGANNLFGIRATDTDPPDQVYILRSGAISHRFRRFAGEEECFHAYARLLSRSRHYAKARAAARNAATNAFLEAMAPVYCPDDPDYALKLRQIIALLDPPSAGAS